MLVRPTFWSRTNGIYFFDFFFFFDLFISAKGVFSSNHSAFFGCFLVFVLFCFLCFFAKCKKNHWLTCSIHINKYLVYILKKRNSNAFANCACSVLTTVKGDSLCLHWSSFAKVFQYCTVICCLIFFYGPYRHRDIENRGWKQPKGGRGGGIEKMSLKNIFKTVALFKNKIYTQLLADCNFNQHLSHKQYKA